MLVFCLDVFIRDHVFKCVQNDYVVVMFFSRLWIVFVCFVVMLFLQCVLRMFYHILYHGFITFFKACLYRFLEHSDLVTFYSVLSCFCYLIAYVITLQTSVHCDTEYCIDFAEEIVSGEDNIL